MADEKDKDGEDEALEAIEGWREEMKRQNKERFVSEMKPLFWALIVVVALLLLMIFRHQ